MSRGIKIGMAAVAGMVVVIVSTVAIVILVFFIRLFPIEASPEPQREIALENHGSLIIKGQKYGRSEHGFSQPAGYRPPESSQIEWFGELSDGDEPQVYLSGPLVIVIDLPGGCLFVRNPTAQEKWKCLALLFPNDLGPSFPLSFYAEKNGLTNDDVSLINELGGRRAQKWPTTYIRSFDPQTRNLSCEYHLDNKNWWPVQFRLSEDGAHLALIEISNVQH